MGICLTNHNENLGDVNAIFWGLGLYMVIYWGTRLHISEKYGASVVRYLQRVNQALQI